MSSDSFIAYFGLRFEVSSDEIESLELRSDPRIIAARKAGLKYYWGNFGGLQEQYLLFVGLQVGILGEENSREVTLASNDIEISFDRTKKELDAAGFSGNPALHLIYQPDI